MLNSPITPAIPGYEHMDITFMKDLPNFGGFMVAKNMVHEDSIISAQADHLSDELVNDKKALMEYLASRYNVIFPWQLVRTKEVMDPMTWEKKAGRWFFHYGWAFGA